MQIELLWIIPIVAFAFFVFILIYFAQKRSDQSPSDLANEVNRFNNGIITKKPITKVPDNRLNELERSILFLTDSITNQQKVIDGFQEKNDANQSEVNDLRLKLRELYKEYDIIVSENYTLKARVKKLQVQKPTRPETDEKEPPTQQSSNAPANGGGSGKTNLRLYEDTRLLNMNSLEDTSEIDLAQVR